MRPECVVLFYSLSQIKPHSSDTVGNEITTRIEFLAKGTVATLEL
jgi:hypothetical protein